MNIFNIEADELYKSFKYIESNDSGFLHFEDEEFNGRTITINDRTLINFANCCYLGLEKHPALIEGAIQAVTKYGTQISTTRGMFSSPLFKELDTFLSKIFPGYPIFYPSTTIAHLSALPLIAKEKDAIILDAYVHNSARLASQLSKANGAFVILAKHNDIEHVRYLIKRLRKEGFRNIWYCADGVYSIQGDVCDILGLHKLLDEEENFFAYVDDAHGMGWSGKNGCGYVIGNFGLHEKMIVAGSLSKSMAALGGFLIVPDKFLADYLKLTGNNFLFSIPVPPVVLGEVIASLKLHLTDEIVLYQKELKDLILYFIEKCKEMSIPNVFEDITPVKLIKIGNINEAITIHKRFMEKGFFLSLAPYPGVSKGSEGLRVSITRHIRKSDIDDLLKTVKDLIP
jgi:7-keto-8-aminopelargonate synthetase-like enzyme